MATGKHILLTAVLAFVLVNAGHAARPSAEKEFFRMEELSPDVALSGRQFYIPTAFGPTGMNGWMHGETLVVREVEAGSPADGIARTNDVITHVNRRPLGAEPLRTLGEAIEDSERTGRLDLRIKRSGREKSVTIPIRKLGTAGKDWPFDCAKSRAIHVDACEYLARNQGRDGMFDGKIYVGFALNGLTWLASDDPRYWEHARRLAYGYRKDFNPEAVSTINWEWSYMGVFLAEYYFKTGDETVLPLCREIAQSLVQSQQPCGTWGHGSYPGLGYVQGGSLNNCGLVCWLALVLIREAGVDVDQRALDRATHFFSRFAHRGGVPYGDHRPEFGGGNGKNAIPGVVHAVLGDRAASEYYARLVTGSYKGRTGGHTGGFMGFVWGNVQGARNPHTEDYRRMLHHWQWLLNVSRRWDGGFLLPESVIGKIYTYRGPILSTGGVAQLYAMPGAALRIHGASKSVFAERDLPPDIEKGIALYRRCRFEALRKVVKPKGRFARQLLEAAERKEADLKLSFAKLESAMADRDFTLARRIWIDLDRYTLGEHPRRGAYNWQVNHNEGAAEVFRAGRIYDRYRWLTYTLPEAREAFEKLAVDASAGIYQSLARRELATSGDATLWAYYCELLWKSKAADWKLDRLAEATALRVADMPSGHWPKIAALNDLYAAGILTRRLANWTPLVAANTKGYPGERLAWRMRSVRRDETPPDGWTAIDFDDSQWEEGAGPLVGGRDAVGMKVKPNCIPYIRVAFKCEETDFVAMSLLLRLLRASKAVVYLNGTPILWSDALQGPRMRIDALTTVPLPPRTIRLLRKGRNVMAMRVSSGQGADFGLYASRSGATLAFIPRPKDWVPGPVLPEPDLSDRTSRRPAVKTVLSPCTTGLVFDPPGQCNASLGDMKERLIPPDISQPVAMPIAERARYFGHFDSRIRRLAAYSLMREGKAAMPFILDALASDDIRVVRAGCDAIAGSFGMNGLGKGNYRRIMTPDIAGAAVPRLLPLVKHEDLYVREGALLALSNCGKAVARHLDQITDAAGDDDWWVRSAVAQVLHYVQAPETGRQITSTVRNYLGEEGTFARNRLRSAVAEMARRGHGLDEAIAALIEEANGENGFHAGMAVGALSNIGPNARAALPLFEERLARAKERLAVESDPGQKKRLERDVRKWEGVIRKTLLQKQEKPKNRKPRK